MEAVVSRVKSISWIPKTLWIGEAELAKSARKKDVHAGDILFHWILKGQSVGILILFLLIALYLYQGAIPAINKFGLSFIYTSVWDPVRQVFGALPVIYGTVVSSLLAVAIAAPLSIGVALFLNELAPPAVARVAGFLVEMLAAIPSVVYGLWGVFVLVPWLRSDVEPLLGKVLGFLPFFQGPAYGVGMLAAGMILAIMITPTISAICREVFRSVGRSQKEAALAIGATRWEMMQLSILKTTRAGILGAVSLGLGRALGETMAVTMLIGNRSQISASLFAPAQTMASVIANEYAEASERIHLAALIEIGLVLFLVTFVINVLARILVWRSRIR